MLRRFNYVKCYREAGIFLILHPAVIITHKFN